MRPEDRRELEEVANRPALRSLLFGVLASAPAHAFTAPSGALAGIVGVVPQGNGAGAIWLSATKDIERHRTAFLRGSREYLKGLPYDTLFNIVDARNEVHIRWLRWLGFVFIRKIDSFGPNGVPVFEFARIKANPCAQ